MTLLEDGVEENLASKLFIFSWEGRKIGFVSVLLDGIEEEEEEINGSLEEGLVKDDQLFWLLSGEEIERNETEGKELEGDEIVGISSNWIKLDCSDTEIEEGFKTLFWDWEFCEDWLAFSLLCINSRTVSSISLACPRVFQTKFSSACFRSLRALITNQSSELAQ